MAQSTRFFPTSTASDLAGSGQLLLSLSRGRGVTSKITNTIASGGAGTGSARVTDGAGGTALEWITNPLNAFTVDYLTTGFGQNIRGLESSTMANVTAGFSVDDLDQSGTFVAAITAGTFGTAPNLCEEAVSTEYGTTEAARTGTTAGGANYALAQGHRLRLRLYGADNSTVGAMASGFTFTTFYNGTTAAASGDTWIDMPNLATAPITEAPAAARIPRGIVNFQNPGVL